MPDSLIDVEGIGSANAAKLNAAGLQTTDDLLKTAGSPAGRKNLAASTGIDEQRILEWVNRADLMRIRGIGSEFSDLLEAAGVDSVVELGRRVPENLHTRMTEINSQKNLVRRLPTLANVESWIAEAKRLDRVVTH
jgi:predicted flap endonuclease-1-like 5' DNA nuclease